MYHGRNEEDHDSAQPWARYVDSNTPEKRRNILVFLLGGIVIWGVIALTFLYFVAIR